MRIPTIEIIRDKDLPKNYADLMNKWRKIEFGPEEIKDFKKDYFPSANFFFVKDSGEIVAFGGLRDVSINYLGKNYKILGICNIISVEKGKGYGQILVSAMIDYLKKTGKAGLGFTKKAGFFRKVGLNVEKDFIKRFVYRNPITKEEIIDNEGDGIYYDGKDGFVEKVLSTKSIVYINIPHW
jgi:hypothetical protein